MIGIKTGKHKDPNEVGLVTSCTPEAWVKAWKINDWNTAHVIINGDDPHIVTKINGVKVCEFDGATTTNEKYKAEREQILAAINKPGSIAVQVHGGGGWPNGARCAGRIFSFANCECRPHWRPACSDTALTPQSD